MSIDEADEIRSYYEDRDSKQARREFLTRMERKLHRKERFGRA